MLIWPTCDMERDCTKPISYIDDKGYIYCDAHGVQRKNGNRCRKLTAAELRRLESGQTLTRY